LIVSLGLSRREQANDEMKKGRDWWLSMLLLSPIG
jgi:hypothetical protein